MLAATACRLSSRGREVQSRFARLTKAGQPRRAYAALGPALAATAVGGRSYTALLWLFGGMQRADDPSDMLVTIAAEDVFDASPELHRIPDARLCLYRGQGPCRQVDLQARHPRDS